MQRPWGRSELGMFVKPDASVFWSKELRERGTRGEIRALAKGQASENVGVMIRTLNFTLSKMGSN